MVIMKIDGVKGQVSTADVIGAINNAGIACDVSATTLNGVVTTDVSGDVSTVKVSGKI
jgi:hypothetical protein